MIYRVWSAERLLEKAAAVGPILGLATGTREAHVGLVFQGLARASAAPAGSSHCATLPDAVEELLAASGLKIGDLKGIGVAIGPGSFTGLRVGLSYAKGLARAVGIPLAGVPTLDAMALAWRSGGPPGTQLCPILDARRGEVYAALYRFATDALERETEDLALTSAELAGLINSDTILIGDVTVGEVRELVSATGYRVRVAGAAELSQTGSMVAVLASVRIARGDRDDIAMLEPRYIRVSDAAQTAR